MRIPRGLTYAGLVAFAACASTPGNTSINPDGGARPGDGPLPPKTDGGTVPDTANRDVAPAWSPPVFDPKALPTSVPTVEITIADDARAALEKAPFYGSDATGTFVDGNGKAVDVSPGLLAFGNARLPIAVVSHEANDVE